MKSKKVHIEGIGEITLKTSPRAKNLNIKLVPMKGVSVSVPKNITFDRALQLLEKKHSWIKKNLPKLKEAEDKYTLFKEDTDFSTRNHTLFCAAEKRENISVVVRKGKISVKYPEGTDIGALEVQKAVREGIERALRIEAKEFLPGRVKALAEKHGFSYNRVYLKNLKSRWGSCSGKGNINLNIHLMRLPDRLIDYIILHELAHTVEPNHSRNYWAVLDKILGDSKKIDREMKQYRTWIY